MVFMLGYPNDISPQLDPLSQSGLQNTAAIMTLFSASDASCQWYAWAQQQEFVNVCLGTNGQLYAWAQKQEIFKARHWFQQEPTLNMQSIESNTFEILWQQMF